MLQGQPISACRQFLSGWRDPARKASSPPDNGQLLSVFLLLSGLFPTSSYSFSPPVPRWRVIGARASYHSVNEMNIESKKISSGLDRHIALDHWLTILFH